MELRISGNLAARGLAAGAIGTAAMTAWQEFSIKLQNPTEDADSVDREKQKDPWEEASAPAKAGRMILERVFHRDVPPEKIGLLTNVMHWGYGISWGVLYGLIHRTSPRSPLRSGLLFGTGVWTMSYLTLVPMGLYEPPWGYPPGELALDLSYHLAYGAGVGEGYAVVERKSA